MDAMSDRCYPRGVGRRSVDSRSACQSWSGDVQCSTTIPCDSPDGPRDRLGFKQAVPGYALQFPADHAAHPDYRTEWWYYTGHLQTTTGKRYGYQLAFFRHRRDSSGPTLNPSKWFADNVYMAHLAITDETARRFVYGEKLNRAALGLAGASEQRYHVWNEDWRAEWLGAGPQLAGDIPGYPPNPIGTPRKTPVLHRGGPGGLSAKGGGPGQGPRD